MTTTSTMSGLHDSEKPTSRVLQPPGGGASDIFGVGPAQPAQARRPPPSNSIFGDQDTSAPSQTKVEPSQTSHANIFGAQAEEHRIYGKGRNQSRYNPITGEMYDEKTLSAADSPPQPAAPPQKCTVSPNIGADVQQDSGVQGVKGKARQDVHTSSRVINPPGGKSSGLW